MSLRGTLGDFGIADIFQLIGHQAKTGVLNLKDREIEVRISFVDGNVVKAEQSSRDKADLLGNIMVRAQALQQSQLDEALMMQQRTLRRLGDILVETNAVDRATLKEFARLQTTETIYRLFGWRAGTYEFVAETVDYDEASYEPIRSENILMEGFRMVDEWPAVRRVVPNAQHSFKIIKDLPQSTSAHDEDDDLLAGLDDALSGKGEDDGPRPRSIGDAERHVFTFIKPGRPASEIVDLSRLGEFETTKALATLVTNGVIAVVSPTAEPEPKLAVWRTAVAGAFRTFGAQLAFGAVSAAVFGGIVLASSTWPGAALDGRAVESIPTTMQEAQRGMQQEKLERALAIYVIERGRYPAQLQDLVDVGLVDEADLRFPFSEPWVWEPGDKQYRLAAPLR